MEKLVIIPTYNERENIAAIIAAVFELQAGYHILIIDDGSPDGTAAIVEDLMKLHEGQLFIEKRSGKLGLGTAYIHGFKWALERKYDYIFEMDCDFSHAPEDIVRLKSACEQGADMAIGSRYCKGGKVKNWPFKRIMMSYLASLYVRMILWIPIKDTTAGFKCYKAKVLETINLDQITFKGYAFQICMKYAALKHGFKVAEVPIVFVDRLYGESKMSAGIFKEAIWGVWKMRKMNL